MKPSFFLTAILLFAVLLILSSCSDDTVTGTAGAPFTVNGIVFNATGFPEYPARVWLNYDAYADVTADGTFTFNNVKIPYNLTVHKQGFTEFTVYEGLTSLSPRMFTSTSGYNFQYNAYIIATLPKASNNGQSRVSFLCKEKVLSYFQPTTSYTMFTSTVSWSGNNNRLEGKVAAIQFERINGQMTAFNKFGFKDTPVSAGDTIRMDFTGSDLAYNPPESSVKIYFPGGSTSNGVNLDIIFTGYKSTSYMWLGGISGSGIPTVYAVPGSLPFDFSIRAYITYSGGSSQLFLQPGNIIYISPVQPINLTSPPNGDSADYNTDFVHDGTSNLYVTTFVPIIQQNFVFNVYSGSRTVRIPVLPVFGINLPPGTVMNWSASGYHGYDGINDFASERRLTYIEHSVVYPSDYRQFYLK